MIPYNLKATGSILLTNEVRDFVDQKLAKVEKLLDPNDTTARVEVELATTGGARTGDMFRAEFNVSFTGGFVRAEATRDTLHAAIDEAISEVKGEIKKVRGKHRDLVRRGAAKVKDFFGYFRGGK